MAITSILLAFIINGSFDVFFEGPMGAFPFWTLVGLLLVEEYYHYSDEDIEDAEKLSQDEPTYVGKGLADNKIKNKIANKMFGSFAFNDDRDESNLRFYQQNQLIELFYLMAWNNVYKLLHIYLYHLNLYVKMHEFLFL